MACKGKGGKKGKGKQKGGGPESPYGRRGEAACKRYSERRAGYPGRYFCARNGLKL